MFINSITDMEYFNFKKKTKREEFIDAAKAIRSLEGPDAKVIPIIAMTANAFAEDAERCINAGMNAGINAHLSKPLDIEKLCKTICELVQ